MMPASKAMRARTADRRAKAVALRIAGATWEQVAKQLNYSGKAAACKDVTRLLQDSLDRLNASIEVLREVESQRLDQLQRGLWSAAVRGDPRSADSVLRIINTRIHLLGLDVQQDLEETTRRQLTLRVAEQMYVVFGRVLDRLGLTPEQRAQAAQVLREAIGAFAATAQPQQAIQATATVEGEAA